MKKITRFINGYKKEAVLGPLLKLFEATLELIVPLIIASIIDRGISGADRTHIYLMVGLLVLLGAVGLAFSVTAQYFCAKASVGFATKMRGELFSHMQTLSYRDIDALGTSTMITRMTADSEKVQSGLNLALRLLLRSPFVVFGAMIMAFTVDAKSALSFVAVIPALSVVVFGIMIISVPLYRRVQSGLDTLTLKARESLSGARVIRAFCKEDETVESFSHSTDTLMRAQIKVGRISAVLNPLTYVLINLAVVWLIWLGAIEVNLGELTQGEVVALYNYMSQILVELIKLANLIVSITKALASADRISAVFDITPSQSYGKTDAIAESEYIVSFKNAAFRYHAGAENSLEAFSLDVKEGEHIGIIGGTGSGKSTLVNLIPRFYDVTEGEVLVGGRPVADYTKDTLRRAVGIVPQAPVLFSGTVRSNLKFGNPDANEEEMWAALKVAQIADAVAEKGGLDAPVSEGGKNFSGGQRQRLTVARAMVRSPKILILDDAASALDYATEAALRRDIASAASGTTVFTVSQRTSSIIGCDKIVVLDDGEAVGIGTHEELLRDCPIYREIHTSQFGEVDTHA
ncbi:MAG: ABC transporter ATP-binding protein [Clostridia bacterium]|nr:ABC transporter ATP-binding protein [Clostridia bacterium]